MTHVNIDKVSFMLAEQNGGTPSPDRSGVKKKASPGTSRVERTKSKSPRPVKPTLKGMARAAVIKERKDAQTYHILVKGTREYVGRVIKQGKGRTSGYGYHLKGEMKTHNGFASQEAAIRRMLTKV